MKNILYVLLLFITINLLNSQDLVVISDSTLSGHYIDFTEGIDNDYYALNDYSNLFKFDFEGNIEKIAIDLDYWNRATSVEIGPDSSIYISSKKGIFKLNEDNSLEQIYDEKISDFAFGKNGEIFAIGVWPLAKYAISIYSDGQWKQFNESNSIMKDDNVFDVKVDSKGVAWVGAQDGLYRIKNGKLRLISDETVWFIHIDQNDKKYLAHSSGDLSTIEPGKTNLKSISWQNATGRFITGNVNGTMYVTEGFRKMYLYYNNVWEKKSLDDYNIPSNIKRCMFMDRKGNMFLSVSDQDDIYVFKNNKVGTFNQIVNDNIVISPNPANDIFRIETSINIDELLLMDSYGNLIFKDKGIKNGYELSTVNMKSGIYFLTLKKKNNVITKKVIVLKNK